MKATAFSLISALMCLSLGKHCFLLESVSLEGRNQPLLTKCTFHIIYTRSRRPTYYTECPNWVITLISGYSFFKRYHVYICKGTAIEHNLTFRRKSKEKWFPSSNASTKKTGSSKLIFSIIIRIFILIRQFNLGKGAGLFFFFLIPSHSFV